MSLSPRPLSAALAVARVTGRRGWRAAGRILVALLLAPCLALAAGEPQVLQKHDGTPGVQWDTLDFADLTSHPTTLAEYGIVDAVTTDYPVVLHLLYQSDETQVYPQNASLLYHAYGSLAGMVCDVMTAPMGGAITLDLLTGSPGVSVYTDVPKPSIAAGDTTTLTSTPQSLSTPVPLVPRERVQVQVVSAPNQALDGTVGLVADLPSQVPVGSRYRVLADNHVWTRAAYDATWTDTGLPTGAEAWLGAVASSTSLPTATAGASARWLVADTQHVWQMFYQVDGHANTYASLPAAGTVNNQIWVTTDTALAYQSSAAAWTSLGTAWTDTGTAWLSTIAFTAIASAASLPTVALGGVYYLALDTGRLWRNDAPPWVDSGLLTIYAGAGLRCALYIYPGSP